MEVERWSYDYEFDDLDPEVVEIPVSWLIWF